MFGYVAVDYSFLRNGKREDSAEPKEITPGTILDSSENGRVRTEKKNASSARVKATKKENRKAARIRKTKNAAN